ncbi:MAG: T9SS type A sorting domain-containing protein, partial [Schleiferiaceae bacterium]|nr:T9SS type A sorting domain-containing protein [Schleiferiaceae bacterium]
VRYGYEGFGLTGGTTLNVLNDSTATLTPLQSDTVYDVYVRDSCGIGQIGAWYGPLKIKTRCGNAMTGFYTVDTLLPSSPTNFASIDEMMNHLNQCGVIGPTTVMIKAGIYNAHMDFNEIQGSSSINYLRILGDTTTSNSTEIHFDGNFLNTIIFMNKTTHVIFENLSFHSIKQSVRITDYCKHITFYKNTFFGINTPSTAANETILRLYGIDDSHINIIENEFNNGSVALLLNGTSWTVKNVLIKGNSIQGFYSGGIQLTDVSKGQVIKNKIYSANLQNEALRMTNTRGLANDQMLIANNFMSGQPPAGSKLVWIVNGAHLNFFNNSLNVTGGNQPVLQVTSFAGNNNKNIQIKNNAIINSGTGNALHISNSFTIDSVLDLNYNTYYSQGTLIKMQTQNYANLNAFKAAYAMDANSLEGEPMFVSNSDLHAVDTLLNDKGTNLGLIEDIDGDPRSSQLGAAQDIGADEYIPDCSNSIQNLVVDSVSSTFTEINWSAQNYTSWPKVEWGVSGFPLGSGTVVYPGQATLQLNNLTPSTTYDVYVLDSCINGLVTNPSLISFTTDCKSVSAGMDSTLQFADSATHIVLLNNYLNGADTGGTWVDPNATGALNGSTVNLALLTNQVNNFYYVVNAVAPCSSDTSIITIELWPISIEAHELNGIKVFPNPTTDRIQIEEIKAGENVQFELIDAQGQTMITGEFNESNNQLDLHNYSSGNYTLVLKKKDEIRSIPVVLIAE